LEKGLTFVPSMKTLPLSNIINSRDRLVRTVKIINFFKNRTSQTNLKSNRSKFIEPSSWVPPNVKLDPETLKLTDHLKLCTDETLENWCRTKKQALNSDPIKLFEKNNLSLDERESLKNLATNPNIIIKPADKGGGTVLLDTINYITEAERQLSNTKYYKLLDKPIFMRNKTNIEQILSCMKNDGFLNKKELQYLSGPNLVKPRNFYLLPKIHKPKDKWPQPDKMPEGRPIVSDVNSETYRISQFLETYLQPLSNKHPSYIKNTYDFLDKIRNFAVNNDYLLVTGDITSLYTNMNINRTLQCVEKLFARNPEAKRPDKYLLKLLELSLKNNDFTFNDKFYLQIMGTAMGKRFAPALANIYLLEFDEAAMNGFDLKPLLFFRYLDDIFFLWPGDLASLERYKNFLNNLIPDITVTFECSETHVNFLDTTIYKSEGLLQSRVYFKSTDTHQLLHTNSFHPKHTFNGILKSQLIRYKRISSNRHDFEKTCKILFSSLKSRGYKISKMREIKNEIWFNYKEKNTSDDQTPLIPVVIDFCELGEKLSTYYKKLLKESSLFQKHRIVTAYRSGPNLKQKLVRSQLCSTREGAFVTCGGPCQTCKFHASDKLKFKSSKTLHIFNIQDNISCNSKNLIYLITCRRCEIQYVGETGRSLRDRTSDHKSCVRLKRKTPIGLHFNSINHSILDLHITPIELIPPYQNDSFRKDRETFWQNKLKTKFPNGLNGLPIN
jgi:hypothetical protein